MAKTTSFALTDHFDAFIEAQVKEGRYASASEVIREALRLLEDRENQRQALHQALREGLASEDLGPLDLKEILREARARKTQRDG